MLLHSPVCGCGHTNVLCLLPEPCLLHLYSPPLGDENKAQNGVFICKWYHLCGLRGCTFQVSRGTEKSPMCMQGLGSTHRIALHHRALHCILLHHAAPHHIAPRHTTLHCVTLHPMASHCTPWHHTVRHGTAWHPMASLCTPWCCSEQQECSALTTCPCGFNAEKGHL